MNKLKKIEMKGEMNNDKKEIKIDFG